MLNELHSYSGEHYCYITTPGRITGRLHEIEIWFALDGKVLYMLAGNRYNSDWVKNIQRNPAVRVRIRERSFEGTGRIVDEASAEAVRARELVGPKYDEWRPGEPLSGWTWEALPVAVDLVAP